MKIPTTCVQKFDYGKLLTRVQRFDDGKTHKKCKDLTMEKLLTCVQRFDDRKTYDMCAKIGYQNTYDMSAKN